MGMENEKSIGELLRGALNNIAEIIRSEFRLAKVELQQAAAKAARPLGTIIVGALLAAYALGFLLLAAMFALRVVLPAWLAALIVFVIATLFAAALIGAGMQAFKRLNRPLERTTANVREQMQWAKQQVR